MMLNSNNLSNSIGKGRGTDKTSVFGIMERKGNVYIYLLPNLSEETIKNIITKKII